MNGTLCWYVDVTEIRRSPRDCEECGRVDAIKRYWFANGLHAEAFRAKKLREKERGFPISVSNCTLPGYTVNPAP